MLVGKALARSTATANSPSWRASVNRVVEAPARSVVRGGGGGGGSTAPPRTGARPVRGRTRGGAGGPAGLAGERAPRRLLGAARVSEDPTASISPSFFLFQWKKPTSELLSLV